MMAGADYSFIIFSFNRGVHLQNCVSSIERHAPQVDLHIIDDDSDDPQTVDILDRLSKRHRVKVVRAGKPTGSKVGGLYVNMQSALDSLPDNHLFSLFQDDMQMVRDLEDQDIEAMHSYFDDDERNGFLAHVFMRGYRRQSLGPLLRYDSKTRIYTRKSTKPSGTSHFAAIHTSRTDRLRNVGYRYADSEKLNNARASEFFAAMGALRDPFASCLPAVPVYRYGMNTWCQRLAVRLSHAGLYPIVPLSVEAIAALRERDPTTALPWSEDFLVTDPPAPAGPWTYSGFQGRRWLKNFNRVEVELRGLFKNPRAHYNRSKEHPSKVHEDAG